MWNALDKGLDLLKWFFSKWFSTKQAWKFWGILVFLLAVLYTVYKGYIEEEKIKFETAKEISVDSSPDSAKVK